MRLTVPTVSIRASVRGMSTPTGAAPAERPAEPLADRPMSWPVVSSRDLHRDDWVVALREDVDHPSRAPRASSAGSAWSTRARSSCWPSTTRSGCMCLRQYRHTSAARVRRAAGRPARRRATSRRSRPRSASCARRSSCEASDWRLLLEHLRQRRDQRRGARHLPGARAVPRAARRLRDARTRRPRWSASGRPWPTCSRRCSTGRVRQGPLAQAVLAYAVLRQRGTLDAR